MGSLAGLLHARGLRVTGSDEHVYPPMSTLLERWGIPVREGFRAEHVLAADPDLVVIGNAVRPDNPEARAVLDEGLPYRSFSDALYELAIRGQALGGGRRHARQDHDHEPASRRCCCEAGRDPSLLVGGHRARTSTAASARAPAPHFVVEGDEYDTAFFDKTPKFLHYHPRTLRRDLGRVRPRRHLPRPRAREGRVPHAGRGACPRDGAIVAALAHEGVRDVVARRAVPRGRLRRRATARELA